MSGSLSPTCHEVSRFARGPKELSPCDIHSLRSAYFHSKERPNTHLVLVGSGQGFDMDIEGRLRSYVVENEMAGTVTFTGAVDNVGEYLQAADHFVLPSESEALPLSLLEAMACGLPSIATSVGGILDIIQDGDNGMLVPYEDTESLCAAFRALVDHEERTLRLGRRGRNTVLRRFDVDHIADRYIALFGEITGRV